MIDHENTLKKQSLFTGLCLVVIFFVASIFFKNMSLVLGYVLGFMLSYLILVLDIEAIGTLISLQHAKTSYFQFFLSIIKMGIYALGFLVAVKVPGLINIYCVAIGYLTVKVTIYRLAMTRR